MKSAFHFQMSTIVFVIDIPCPSKDTFGDRNIHKVFSALSFSIIFIKPFTSNLITQHFEYPFEIQSVLNETLFLH